MGRVVTIKRSLILIGIGVAVAVIALFTAAIVGVREVDGIEQPVAWWESACGTSAAVCSRWVSSGPSSR